MANRYIEELKKAVIDGNADDAIAKAKALISSDVPPLAIIESLQGALRYVGLLFEEQEIFLVEMYASAKAVKACHEYLAPMMMTDSAVKKEVIMLGTVKTDVHDIGKNIVKMVLEANGFEVFDLGVDVAKETFVEKALEIRPDIIGMSSLMTTTMEEMKQTVVSIREHPDLEKTLIVVGGAPISQEYADKIGADGYAKDAAGSVPLIERLLQAIE